MFYYDSKQDFLWVYQVFVVGLMIFGQFQYFQGFSVPKILLGFYAWIGSDTSEKWYFLLRLPFARINMLASGSAMADLRWQFCDGITVIAISRIFRNFCYPRFYEKKCFPI